MVAPSRSSTRASARNVKTPDIRQSFGKVSKAHSLVPGKKSLEVEPVVPSHPVEKAPTEKKRKRDTVEEQIIDADNVKKARKTIAPVLTASRTRNALTARHNIPTASFSNQGSDEVDNESNIAPLPDSLSSLIALHESFLQAMSLHFAHNGTSAPASLSNLLDIVTRVWKRRQVQKQDIRKMLGLLEIGEGSNLDNEGQSVQRARGSFRLFQSGLGIQHLLLEYVGQSLNERVLQDGYRRHLEHLWRQSQWSSKAVETLSDFSRIPQLAIEIGTQQVARNEKGRALRASVLSPTKSKSTPESSPLNSSTQASQPSARKQTLLDRILIKQRAALSTPQPTEADLIFAHAKSRLPELVDILGQIQRQRTRNQLIGRISFSFGQLAMMIKDSMRMPIEEASMWKGLEVLAREEVGSGWVGLDGVGSEDRVVVLRGRGLTGQEVRERLSRL